MAVTKAFYEAVNLGNVRRVRIIMKNSLLVDPSFTEFKEMEKVVASMKGVYDSHDGGVFEENRANWNDNYMAKQMVELVSNFSHERISHVKEVVRYLYPVARTTQTSTSTRTESSINCDHMSYEEKKRRDQLDGSYLGAKVATGVVAGAVVGGIVASTAGITVVGGAIVGAAVGGVAVSIVVNGGH